MKTSILVGALLLSSLIGLHADQTATTAGSSAQTPTLPAPTEYHVVSLGANHQVWQRETYEQGPDGQVMTHVHSYTELASGLNYWNNGQWQASQELIEAFPSGAVARQGQYQVIFANNLNSAGSIDMETPDGKRLQSSILGLMYHDTASGQAVLIAQIQDSTGELISSNQVLYPDAFSGVKADVRYTYKTGSFEQDVILRQQPPTPESLGLHSATTEIEVMTEFIDPPSETIATSAVQPNGETDENVSWGMTRLGHGRAFDLGGPQNPGQRVSVIRQYEMVQGREILLEKVPLEDIQTNLQQLPLQSSIQTKRPLIASQAALLPRTPLAQVQPEPMKLALAAPAGKGYVLDYVELNTDTNDFTFQADTTYYISGNVNLSGTNYLESGTVLKFGSGSINVLGRLNCETTPDQPAIFTVQDDDLVGETISGSTGNPLTRTNLANEFYYQPTDYTNSSVSLHDLNVRYLYTGVSIENFWYGVVNTDEVRDCEFAFVNTAVYAYAGKTATTANNVLELRNVLVDQNTTALSAFNGVAWSGENVTVHNVNYLWQHNGAGNTATLALTNSLLIGVTNLGDSFAGVNNSTNGSDAGIFQSAGLADDYLAAGSPYRDVGTTNIDPALLAQLQTMTTYAPQDGGWPDTNTPDLGYHYPTNEDSDYDGLPDWWEWKWFGNYDQSGDSVDANGNTLLYDYTNGVDPIGIQFTLEVDNNYVTNSSLTVQVNVTAGIPTYYAVLVDNTNFDSATWTSYASSNLTVSLGSTQGWYEVWIGVQGPSTNDVAWVWKRLKLDTMPPQLALTSPTNGTVNVPIMQLNGYSVEALQSISYDLTNALGLVTNQQILILNQYHDTNSWEFTTNTFQAFDVALTNGVNTFILHATDLAGNVMTTNFSFTVDYTGKTAPAVALTWPLDGMQLCGSNVTVRGQVDDPTVSVSATITDTNGDTNIVTGLVERNGRFWVENLPLNSGTNVVSITLSNVIGQTTVTNINLLQSALTLTMNAVSDDSQLWQPTLSVGGNISDGSDAVWVNGVAGVNNGDGTWSADNVPTPPGGVATFDVTAYPPAEAPSGGGGSGVNPQTANSVSVSTDPDKPAEIYVAESKWNWTYAMDWNETITYSDGTQYHYTRNFDVTEDDGDWINGLGGGGIRFENDSQADDDPADTEPCPNSTEQDLDDYTWPASEWPQVLAGTDAGIYMGTCNGVGPDVYTFTNTGSMPQFDYSHCYQKMDYEDPVNETYDGETDVGNFPEKSTKQNDLTLNLRTGGKGVSQRRNLFCLSATVERGKYTISNGGYLIGFSDLGPIAAANITLNGKALGSDGNLWLTLPDNTEMDVTPRVKNEDCYTFNEPTPPKYHPYINLSTSTTNANLDTDTPEVCVGQLATFTLDWSPNAPPIVNMVGQWNLPDKFVNQPTNYSATCLTYVKNDNLLHDTNQTACWYVNKPGGHVSVGMNLLFPNGQHASVAANGNIKVVKPSIVSFINGPFQISFNTNNADVSASMDWRAYVQPPDYFSGQAQYVQLVKRNTVWSAVALGFCVGKPTDTTDGEFWLDNNNPYPDLGTPTRLSWNDNPVKSVPHDDSPGYGSGLCDSIFVDDHFETYLQFQPDGGISVTIDRIDWGWSGNAVESSGTWSWFFSPSGPTEDRSDDSFPVWPETYHN